MRAHSHLVCFNPTWCRDAGSKPKDAFFVLRLVRSFSFLFIPFFSVYYHSFFYYHSSPFHHIYFPKLITYMLILYTSFILLLVFFKISYFSECFLCFIFRLIILIIFPNVFFLSHVL